MAHCRNGLFPKQRARQLADISSAGYKALGVIPSQKKIVLERSSMNPRDATGHPCSVRRTTQSGVGACPAQTVCGRSFNFELQAAATDDAIVLSLGTQHSFPLEEVFHYLNSKTVREVLVQALLDAPCFPFAGAGTRRVLWRSRAGATGAKYPRHCNEWNRRTCWRRCFRIKLACLENIVGDREVPDHPLVKQTG